MLGAIQNTKSLASLRTVRAMCRVFPVLVSLFLGLMGCAVQDYSPPLLPSFGQAQTPAGVAPPVGQDDLSKPSVRASRGAPTQALSVPPEPRTASFPGEIASVSDAPQSGEPSSPQPTVVRSRGLTLEQVIQTTLEADPKIQAGLETINPNQG